MLCILMLGVLSCTVLDASSAVAEDGEVTPAADALPGIHRVGIAHTPRPTLSGTLGYGFTEAQNEEDAAHHRIMLRAAGAVPIPIVPWLALGALIDARYDQHEDDRGSVIGGALYARAAFEVGKFQIGGELAGRLPGAEHFATAFRGTSLEARALLATTAGGVRLASQAGYRLDRTGETTKPTVLLSPGDRLALGVSDFDAILVGLGAIVPVGKTAILAEVSGDVLVGSGAPGFLQSPLRAALGVRHPVTRGLHLELLAVASLSQKPDLSPGAPRVPNEPRVSVFAGVRYEFLAHADPTSSPSSPPPSLPKPAVTSPPTAPLEVQITDEQGALVVRPTAYVTFEANGERRELTCDEVGRCRTEDARTGELFVHAEASGFEGAEQRVTVRAGATTHVELRLVALPPASQLRGVVRSLDGTPVAARVRVEPLGTQKVVGKTGRFELDLPPGGYDVVIEAPGYVTQRRHVQVEPKGVVVLNADLVKARR